MHTVWLLVPVIAAPVAAVWALFVGVSAAQRIVTGYRILAEPARATQKETRLSRRYTAGARFHDVLSGERWVYRAGRVAGIRLLSPARGGAVLDLGCGTGLNLPLLADAVGPEGLVIGVDSSPSMLAVARKRIASSTNIAVLEGDAVHLDAGVASC